jgi:hypothetical protein
LANYCDENEIIKLIDTIRSSSVVELKYQQVKVYPNPVNGVATVAFTMKEDNFTRLS